MRTSVFWSDSLVVEKLDPRAPSFLTCPHIASQRPRVDNHIRRHRGGLSLPHVGFSDFRDLDGIESPPTGQGTHVRMAVMGINCNSSESNSTEPARSNQAYVAMTTKDYP